MVVPSDFDNTVFEPWSLSLSLPIVRATMWLANSSGSIVCGVVVGVSDSGTIFVASTWMIQVQLRLEREDLVPYKTNVRTCIVACLSSKACFSFSVLATKCPSGYIAHVQS